MRRTIFNQNYFGTHFGGSLYAMVNPFFPLLILNQLPPGHIVWDTAAKVSFVRAVQDDVFADISVDRPTVESLAQAAETGEKVLRWFNVDVTTAHGEVVATAAKEIYIRRKRPTLPCPPLSD